MDVVGSRSLMFTAAGLDLVGQMFLLLFLVASADWLPLPVAVRPWIALGLTVFCLFIHTGWLFGGYTVPLRASVGALQRVPYRACTLLGVVARWVTNPPKPTAAPSVFSCLLSGVPWSLLVRWFASRPGDFGYPSFWWLIQTKRR